MDIEVMTLRYDAAGGQFDAAPLREFTRDKVVLRLREHFHQVDDKPHLTLLIEYR